MKIDELFSAEELGAIQRTFDDASLIPDDGQIRNDLADCIKGILDSRDEWKERAEKAEAELASLRQQAALDTARFAEMQEKGQRLEAELAGLNRRRIEFGHENLIASIRALEGAGMGADGKPNTLRAMVEEAVGELERLRKAAPTTTGQEAPQPPEGWHIATDEERRSLPEGAHFWSPRGHCWLASSEMGSQAALGFIYACPNAPEMVPLEACDVRPGSVIRERGKECEWYNPGNVCGSGVVFINNFHYTWQELARDFEISRDNGKTWEKCQKVKGGA